MKHVHLRKLPTPPSSSLDSGVIMRSRVMKLHYREFFSNHITERFFKLLNLIDLSDFLGVTYNFEVTLFHNTIIFKTFQT